MPVLYDQGDLATYMRLKSQHGVPFSTSVHKDTRGSEKGH